MLKWVAVPAMIVLGAAGSHLPSQQGVAAPAVPVAAAKVYTLTNLHFDPRKPYFYSQNMIMADLLPMCTEVTIGERSSSDVQFTVVSTKTQYHYELRSKATPEGLEKNFARYFGPSCDSAAVAKMSEIDRQGIKEGKALVGMTKQAVIYAIGYPPTSQTPSTDANEWRYWHSRFDTFIVYFTDGKVSSLKE